MKAFFLGSASALAIVYGIGISAASIASGATALGVGFVAYKFGLPIAAASLATGDIIYTVAGEGKAKAVGKSKDAFGTVPLDHFVMSWQGYHLNDPRFLKNSRQEGLYNSGYPPWEVLPNDPSINPELYEVRSGFAKNIGVHPVGIPVMRNVYVYKFKWSEIKVQDSGDEKGTEDIWPREEWTNFIFVKPIPYAMTVDKVLTKDLIPVKALITVTIRVNNPDLALFGTGSWFQQGTAVVDRVARDYIGVHTYYEIKSESAEPPSKEDLEAMQQGAPPSGITPTAGPLLTHTSKDRQESFSRLIIKLTDELLDEKDPNNKKGLKGTYGISIESVDLRWVRREDDKDHTIADAQTLPWVAKQQKEATITKAEGEARAKELLGQAEANALNSRLEVLSRHGNTGALLAQLDAIVDSSKGEGKTIIWANNPLLQQNFPGLGEILDKAGVTSSDALRQFVEQRSSQSNTTAATSAPSAPNTGAAP
jgi:regulator of protease activity HflC (stomatin/prohibitin superfamily)